MTVRPNVLLLLSDQHRADAMGCAGDPIVQTPNLDRLAAEGVRFENAFCTSPLCMPSRASFTTGMYAHNHGILGNTSGNLLPHLPTFLRGLQEVGYHTAGVGKFHYFMADAFADTDEVQAPMLAYGFDEVLEVEGKAISEFHRGPWTRYLAQHGLEQTHREDYRLRRTAHPSWYAAPSPLGEEHHQDAFIGREAAAWIDRYRGEEPFCLWASWVGPHPPWDAPGRYATMYDPLRFRAPAADRRRDLPGAVQRLLARYKLADATPAELARMKASYYGLITHVDQQVGSVLGALERRGILDDTIVVYFSDHGEMLGEHQLLQKWVFYEAAIRVPLIVRYPRRFAGGVAPALVELVDLPRTLLELAGAAPYAACEGRSLLPVLERSSQTPADWRDAVYSELEEERMIRTDRFKYTYRVGERRQELFDLAADPGELDNLAGTPAASATEREMHDRLLRWLVATNRPFTSRDLQPGVLDAYRARDAHSFTETLLADGRS